jgi:hypothetical protein
MGLFRKKKKRAPEQKQAPAGGQQQLGILYNIDELGGGFYGWKAYSILFRALDPKRLTGCSLLDGDTSETLAGGAREYCIAIHSPDPAKIDYVREVLLAASDPGLLPPDRRFLQGDVRTQPLVPAGEIDSEGRLVVREGSMIGEGWTEGTEWTVVTR